MTLRVFVADDAATLRGAFRRIAAALGYEVVGEAVDLPGALQAVAALRDAAATAAPAAYPALATAAAPDVIVVDSRFPPGGGLVAIRALKAAAPEAAIYVAAALGETEFVRAAVRAGAAGAMLRPYLVSQIRAALGRQAGVPRDCA